jgi:hypothetical protein
MLSLTPKSIIMKHSAIIFFLVVALLQGCKKEENEVIKSHPGKSELFFNDTKTNRFRAGASYIQNNKNKAVISFLYAINDLYSRENFTISVDKLDNTVQQRIFKYDRGDISIPFDPNKAMSSFNTLSEDGDVLCHTYDVLEKDSLNNWIKITKYNEKTRELSGEFSITYIKTRECTSFSSPDTIRIRNGVFSTTIKK